jgi:hypothetical protein
MESRVVQQVPLAHSNTHALSVDPRTVQGIALRCEDLLRIVTPLRWRRWEEYLAEAGLGELFKDVPKGIRYGFDLGVDELPKCTFIPRNHKSALENPDVVEAYIKTELDAGRYLGPFEPEWLESVIGPFHCSPLGAIEETSKFRIIQDHSFPRNNTSQFSLNSLIDPSRMYESTWCGFAQAYLLAANAPPGTEVSVFDVAAAFRIIPIRPDQQVWTCLSWNNMVYVDPDCSFGGRSSSGNFGITADAASAIYVSKGVDDVIKWADDFTFWRYPISISPSGLYNYSYDESLIWRVGEDLGWPWSPKKHFPFSTKFTYLGFEWDLDKKTVTIGKAKCAKYIDRLKPWKQNARFTKLEVQKLIGTLNHCSVVLVEGRSRLPSLYHFVGTFRDTENAFVTHTATRRTITDTAWWRAQLAKPWCGTHIVKIPEPLRSEIFVDASTSWGIGFVWENRWLAWKLLPGWKSEGREIGWAEMVAVELAYLTLVAAGFSNCHVILRSDNQGVVGALKNDASRNSQQNTILRRIISYTQTHAIWLTTKWIPSEENVADGPSRGVFPTSPRYPCTPRLPFKLKPFLSSPV